MIRILAMLMTIGGMVALTLGVLGVFGNNLVGMNAWALSILGGIFFISGVSMLKYRKDKPIE